MLPYETLLGEKCFVSSHLPTILNTLATSHQCPGYHRHVYFDFDDYYDNETQEVQAIQQCCFFLTFYLFNN